MPGLVTSGERPCTPAGGIPPSAGETPPSRIMGWESTGELRIVGPFACPFCTATIKSAACASDTSLNLPHFAIAFSTLVCAVRFAFGLVRGSPASGRITTATVCALSTYSGSTCFFLFFAFAWGTNRRRTRKAIGTRTDIAASVCLFSHYTTQTDEPRTYVSQGRSPE